MALLHVRSVQLVNSEYCNWSFLCKLSEYLRVCEKNCSVSMQLDQVGRCCDLASYTECFLFCFFCYYMC